MKQSNLKLLWKELGKLRLKIKQLENRERIVQKILNVNIKDCLYIGTLIEYKGIPGIVIENDLEIKMNPLKKDGTPSKTVRVVKELGRCNIL